MGDESAGHTTSLNLSYEYPVLGHYFVSRQILHTSPSIFHKDTLRLGRNASPEQTRKLEMCLILFIVYSWYGCHLCLGHDLLLFIPLLNLFITRSSQRLSYKINIFLFRGRTKQYKIRLHRIIKHITPTCHLDYTSYRRKRTPD